MTKLQRIGLANSYVVTAGLLLTLGFVVFVLVSALTGQGTARVASARPEASNAALDDVYTRRMQFALDGTSQLEINLKLQGILIIISILLLARGIGESKTVTVLGTEVSSGMLRLVEMLLPLALLYLWIEFGYLFLDLIDNRVILLKLIQVREHGNTSIFSARHVLPDHFFVLDPWFYLFDKENVATYRQGHILWISIFKMIVFTAFLGASHASSLALVCDFADRLILRKWMKVAATAYMAVVVGAVVATHLEFRVVGEKSNYGQYLIFAWAIGFTVLFSNLRRWHLHDRRGTEPAREANLVSTSQGEIEIEHV